MRPDRMELDPRAFGFAAGVVAVVVFTLCALAIAIAPSTTTAALSYLLHLDLTGLARPLTWGSYSGGLICLSIGAGLAFGAAGALYNRFLRGLPDAAGGDVVARRTA